MVSELLQLFQGEFDNYDQVGERKHSICTLFFMPRWCWKVGASCRQVCVADEACAAHDVGPLSCSHAVYHLMLD